MYGMLQIKWKCRRAYMKIKLSRSAESFPRLAAQRKYNTIMLLLRLKAKLSHYSKKESQ